MEHGIPSSHQKCWLVEAVRLGEVITDGEDVWWAESRPDEGGRTVLVRNGKDQLDKNSNVRTLVHEYGGGAWWVKNRTLIYSQYSDQRLYMFEESCDPIPLTPETEEGKSARYADGRITENEKWYVCVRELHVSIKRSHQMRLLPFQLDGSANKNLSFRT